MIHRRLFDPGRVTKLRWRVLTTESGKHDEGDAILPKFAGDLCAGLITESNVQHS